MGGGQRFSQSFFLLAPASLKRRLRPVKTRQRAFILLLNFGQLLLETGDDSRTLLEFARQKFFGGLQLLFHVANYVL